MLVLVVCIGVNLSVDCFLCIIDYSVIRIDLLVEFEIAASLSLAEFLCDLVRLVLCDLCSCRLDWDIACQPRNLIRNF